MAMWKYGNSWEEYPIKAGEVWVEGSTDSKLAVWDLFDGLPDFMMEADLIYTDPPWDTGNIRSFYTKAGLDDRPTFTDFTRYLFDHLKAIEAPTCYLEIGKRNVELFEAELKKLYPMVQVWSVTYYGKNPSFLVRGGQEKSSFCFTGHDDAHTPRLAMENEWFSCVADLCMGRGLTAVTAFEMEQRFVGTELHPRRLACAIEKVAKEGGKWRITQP
jgi:hypothetical protein